MRKLFTLFCLVATVSATIAQTNYRAMDASLNGKLKPAPYATKPTFHQSTNRAATTQILLDYDGNDQQYSTDNGYDYTGYLWGVNSRFGNTDNLNLDYAAVYYDTLQYLDGNNALTFIPLASSTVTLDSFVVAFVHEHTTNNNDTIRFTVFNTSAATVTNYGAPNSVFTTPSLWDTVIVTNTTIPLNTTNYTFATFAPGITLPQGKSFGIRIDFAGDTANKFNIVAGYRDQCAAACAAEIAVAGNNSAYYLNLTTQTGTNLSGYFENNSGGIYYDCDQSGGFTVGGCENFYIQNIWTFAYASVSSNYGAVIVADSLKGCPGATLNLTANAFGSNDAPFTYNWATSSGTLTSTGDQQVGLVIGSTNATVTVTVTDANNQTTSATATVSSKGINLSITNSDPLTLNCGGNATVTTQISGTTTGKNYTWSTGATGPNASTIQVSTIGNYSVTVTNNSGCSASASLSVVYPGGLTNNVSFTNPPSPICEDKLLTFTNTTTRQTGWNANWTFGDGNVGFTANGTNTYANPGVYGVSLQMDSAGCIFKSPTVNVTVLAASNAACVNGIEDVTFSNNITMLPNPTNGNVAVTVNGVEKNVSIRVYNVIGSEVKTFNANEVASTFTKTFDFGDLANGTYLVKIQTADKTAIKRLTISK